MLTWIQLPSQYTNCIASLEDLATAAIFFSCKILGALCGTVTLNEWAQISLTCTERR